MYLDIECQFSKVLTFFLLLNYISSFHIHCIRDRNKRLHSGFNIQCGFVRNLLGVTSVRCATEVTAVVTFDKDVAIVSTVFKVRRLVEPLVATLVLRHTPCKFNLFFSITLSFRWSFTLKIRFKLIQAGTFNSIFLMV